MNRWDVVLLVIAAYVATMALVRLMIRRRGQLLDEFYRQVKMKKKRKTGKQQEQDSKGQQTKAA